MFSPFAGLSPFTQPRRTSGGGGVVTDYANYGGTGERNSIIAITQSTGLINADNTQYLINGLTSNQTWFNGGITTGYLIFDFGSGKVIDEAKYYTDSAVSQGDWKWQGSNDNSSYSDIGSSFTLGSSTTQTLATLSGNTTSYRYYKLLQVSGSTSAASYFKEIEFKISPAPGTSTSYSNTGGTGNRTGSITVSSTITWNGTLSNIVNGNTTETNNWMSAEAVSGKYIRFDFGSGKTIDEAKWYQNGTTSQGTWKWQGSNDASSWTDLCLPFELGTVSTQTLFFLNTGSYRYYQLLGVSGSSSSANYTIEMEFKIGP